MSDEYLLGLRLTTSVQTTYSSDLTWLQDNSVDTIAIERRKRHFALKVWVLLIIESQVRFLGSVNGDSERGGGSAVFTAQNDICQNNRNLQRVFDVDGGQDMF